MGPDAEESDPRAGLTDRQLRSHGGRAALVRLEA